jgi:glycosyltransferase involved in cell wall biosynthesis
VPASTHQATSVTIIVPCYQKSDVIKQMLERVIRVLDSAGILFRIRVVLDGPDHFAEAQIGLIPDGRIETISLRQNIGKGGAIRAASDQIESNYVAFIDADMDLHPHGIVLGVHKLNQSDREIAAAYGSKLHAHSRVNYPVARRISSKIFRIYLRYLLGLRVEDSQVGLKVFRSDTFREAIKNCSLNGFAFDIEILTEIHALGMKSVPIPVELTHMFSTTVTIRAAARTLFDVLKIRSSTKTKQDMKLRGDSRK